MDERREQRDALGIGAEVRRETRVTTTPAIVRQLAELGDDIVVDKDSAESASFRSRRLYDCGRTDYLGLMRNGASQVVLRVDRPMRKRPGVWLTGNLDAVLSARLATGLGGGAGGTSDQCAGVGRRAAETAGCSYWMFSGRWRTGSGP
jgi:hypothetical protein